MTNYLTATQAAQRLGTSLTNVARWCRDGTLPATRLGIGRIWQIPVEAVEAFTPPARGPKPAEDRKRLLDLAKEMVEAHPVLVDYRPDGGFHAFVVMLAQQGRCSQSRARQALAKAIRLVREEQIKASHLTRLDHVIDNLRNSDDSCGNDEDPALRPDQP